MSQTRNHASIVLLVALALLVCLGSEVRAQDGPIIVASQAVKRGSQIAGQAVSPQITGQLPLAFDIAVPVSKAEGDRVRYFSFFVGAFW